MEETTKGPPDGKQFPPSFLLHPLEGMAPNCISVHGPPTPPRNGFSKSSIHVTDGYHSFDL